MRGLAEATLLLASAISATARPLEDVRALAESVPTAFVTLGIPNHGHVSAHDLTLRLHVLEASSICGPADIKVNGESLAQPKDAGSPESGALAVEGSSVVGSWNITCIQTPDGDALEQVLSLAIETIDSDPIDNVRFQVRFKQVAPVSVYGVEGATLSTALHVAAPGLLADGHVEAHDEEEGDRDMVDRPGPEALHGAFAHADLVRSRIADLEAHLDGLKEHLHATESFIAEQLGWPASDPPRPDLESCKTLNCIIGSLVGKVKSAAGNLFDSFRRPGHSRPHGHGRHRHDRHHAHEDHPRFCPCAPPRGGPAHPTDFPRPHPHHEPPTDGRRSPLPSKHGDTPHDSPEHHGPPSPHFPHQPPWAPHPSPSDDEFDTEENSPPPPHHPPPPPGSSHALNTPKTVVLAIFILGAIVGLIRRCYCSRLSPQDRDTLIDVHRRPSTLRSIFSHRRLLSHSHELNDEEKRHMIAETHASRRPEQQATDAYDSESDSDMSTTMEEDIARLRQAASMIGNIISGEAEARNRALMHAPRMRQSIMAHERSGHTTPPSPTWTLPLYVGHDTPPEYMSQDDMEETASSMVPDGVRRSASPSNTGPPAGAPANADELA